MSPTRLLPVAALLGALLGAAGPARAQALIADLSDHLIAITTGFTGTDVLLFGAIEEPGDVIVVVRGPVADVTVRRKDRLAGVWVNRGRMDFADVPSFYAVAANRPIYEIADPALLARHGIGIDFLRLEPIDPEKGVDIRAYREALVRIERNAGRYAAEVERVSFLSQRLFRTTISFPANVPTGSYLVEVLLLQDGEVVSAQTTPLVVSKVGLGADVYEFAYNQPALHGVVAIVIALVAGWLAHLVFRRI